MECIKAKMLLLVMDNGLSLVQSYEGENIYEEHGLSSTEEEERGANSTRL